MDILGKWRDVYEEAVRLCQSMEHVPEECPCGDADAHLAGRCACCGGHAQKHQEHPTGQSCKGLLASLRAEVVLFCEDFKRTAGPLEEAARDEVRPELRRDIFLTAADLEQLLATLDEANETVAGFLRTCTVSDLKRVKRHSVSLRAHCERLNSRLQTVAERSSVQLGRRRHDTGIKPTTRRSH